jgi:acetyl-CoA carboxylase biotin carboxyl carrier protein
MLEDTIANRVRPLAAAFRATDLVRLTLRDGALEVEFRRSAAVRAVAGPPAATSAPTPPPSAHPPDVLTSDVVGIVRFLRPTFNEGQELTSDRELAFVEALGIRNPVRSRGAGRLTAILVADGQPVEYGQPLFAIER